MTLAETVTVYNFHLAETWSSKAMPTTAPYKATIAVIEGLGGKVLEGTAEVVPVEWVDADGRYQRVATGWGSLA